MTSILRLQNIKHGFGGVLAVNDVSLDVATGSITGLIGPNGAGKTSIFGIVSGFLSPNSGDVFFEEQNITGMPPHEIARLGMARTFQIPQLFNSLTVRETLIIATSVTNRADTIDEVIRMANDMGIGGKLEYVSAELTTSDMRLLEILKAFATGARLVLLDEVFAGLSSTEIDRTAAVIRAFSGEKTFLIIEHRMRAIMSLCHHVNVLIQGQLVASGTPEEVTKHPKVITAYLGTEGLTRA